MDKAARYVEAAVEGERRAVATIPAHSGRNGRLYGAAINLGELVGAGLCPRHVVEDVLEDAAHECGLVRDDGLRAVRATIASGLRKGAGRPREVKF